MTRGLAARGAADRLIIAALALDQRPRHPAERVVVNALTIGKLVPLAVFIVVGLSRSIRPARLTTLPPIALQQSLGGGAAADLRLRRLRSGAGAGRRSDRSAARRAVRADHDDRRR